MGVYGGIDLHSNNQVVALVDEAGELVHRRREEGDSEHEDSTLDILPPCGATSCG